MQLVKAKDNDACRTVASTKSRKYNNISAKKSDRAVPFCYAFIPLDKLFNISRLYVYFFIFFVFVSQHGISPVKVSDGQGSCEEFLYTLIYEQKLGGKKIKTIIAHGKPIKRYMPFGAKEYRFHLLFHSSILQSLQCLKHQERLIIDYSKNKLENTGQHAISSLQGCALI